jgi:hypothetical protein
MLTITIWKTPNIPRRLCLEKANRMTMGYTVKNKQRVQKNWIEMYNDFFAGSLVRG